MALRRYGRNADYGVASDTIVYHARVKVVYSPKMGIVVSDHRNYFKLTTRIAYQVES